MPNFRNKYTDHVCVTVRLSSKDRAYLSQLANISQTLDHVYLEELIESALMDKRIGNNEPNYYQRMQTEAQVYSAMNQDDFNCG